MLPLKMPSLDFFNSKASAKFQLLKSPKTATFSALFISLISNEKDTLQTGFVFENTLIGDYRDFQII